ncbi:serine--tRNA ligase [Desulfurococcus amylolyticus]|uniref:Serine--tRNA ligase n=1 Tax=Desulfurococcus amylolyticus (strain DSM 18924 / JCM 16383 / VKM B-2413 / 1221n) TaxID=490899 RepID=SYS_DESA1|nr:serine--tRNA ligase [Desulfurococcus amylolyticus]B8D3V1.1 RecName: Full=Serine--tRNA ligase; AltName: Full=Seryl-tRNA synthetase; Short=SerRS; AltName: Full=Seryl-tRNA(Ser/Sec) synthetase [Desulfurococcus amylolyticus 1221n]ACL10782.1 Seryl-tRNA synthetase [Desulfurococcus amylolyticus 1221n]
MSWSILTLLRDNPELLKEHVKKRFMDPSLVDEAYKLDLEWRRLLSQVQELRHRHNVISRDISKLPEPERSARINEARELLSQMEELEKKLKEIEDLREEALLKLPNIVHETVPVGPDDTYNVPIRFWGKPKVWSGYIEQFMQQTERYGFKVEYELVNWKPVGHADMLEYVLRLGDTVKAGEVAGSRFYYLFDDIVFLDIALLMYAIDSLTSKGYKLVLPPYMLRHKVMSGVIDLATFKDAIYKIEGEDLYLIATAEHSLAALHAFEEIPEEELPLKYVGVSPCFRKEAGAGNRDLKGIFRVHQFHKVEQYVYAKPEESWALMEELIGNAEDLFKGLELPYRVVNIASGDLGAPAAKKYDLETWMPAQGLFREMVSCSNTTDWQSYRLKTRLVRRKGMVKEYVHTLNSTAIASTRTITSILENRQNEDGTVTVPRVLRKYLEVFNKAPRDYIHPVKRERA